VEQFVLYRTYAVIRFLRDFLHFLKIAPQPIRI